MRFAPRSPLLPLLAVAACGLVAAASAGFRVGASELKPRLNLEGSQDSNIFLQSSAPVSSAIIRATPGIVLSLDAKRLQLLAGYDLAFLDYTKFPKVNNAVHQTGMFSLHQEPMQGGTLAVEDLFKATTDPASSELTERVKRNQNDAGVGIEVPLTPMTFGGVRITDTLMRYSATSYADILNRNEVLAGVRAGWNATAKTRFFGFYRFSSVKYDLNHDDDSGGAFFGAGVEGDLTHRLTGSVEAGSMARHYSKTRTGGTRDATLPRYAATLAWAGPADWSAKLNAERVFVESLFNRYYVSDSAAFSVTKAFAGRFEAQVLGSYGSDRYPDLNAYYGKKRSDVNVQAGASLRVALNEQQSLAVRYLSRSRTSNIGVLSFKDALVAVSYDLTL